MTYQLPPFKAGREPRFDVLDTVWIIQGRIVVRQVVLAVNIAVLVGGNDDDEKFLITTGYDVAAWNTESCGCTFRPVETYGSEDEAERMAVWHPVGATDGQWWAAIGMPDDDFSIDASELGRCCADIARIRAILHKCRTHGGLIERDVSQLKSLIEDHSHSQSNGYADNLKNILSQLGLTWPTTS